MTSSWRYALTIGPLGLYLGTLAFWQSGRRPRVVAGRIDVSMLALGVGGLLAFGPFGRLVTRLIFRKPDPLDRLAVVAGLALGACLLARGAARRLVVYQVDAAGLIPALDDVLNQSGEGFVRTLRGFEDVARTRGVRVEFARRLRCATIEAEGPDAEAFIGRLRPRLVQTLRGVASCPSWTPRLLLYASSILVMLAPLVGNFMTHSTVRSTLRFLLERLPGL